MIRNEVQSLIDMGSLPDSSAEEETIEAFDDAMRKISAPLTREEALGLLGVFGTDDCFGLAWTLLHLVESATSPPLASPPAKTENEWIRLLWERSQGGG